MVKMNWNLILFFLLVNVLALAHAGDDYREEDASEEMEYGTIMRIIPAPSPSIGNRIGNGGTSKSAKVENLSINGKSPKNISSQATSVKSSKASAKSSKSSSRSSKNSSSSLGKSNRSPKKSDKGIENSGYAIENSTGGKSAKSSPTGQTSSGTVSKGTCPLATTIWCLTLFLSHNHHCLIHSLTGPGKTNPGKNSTGNDGNVNSGSDTGKNPPNTVQNTMVSTLSIPKFMLTMTNAVGARVLRSKYARNLGTYLDFSILKIVRAYLSDEGGEFEKAIGASVQMLSLDIGAESIIVKNGDSKTFISTFEGTASFTGEEDVTVNDLKSALRASFEENKKEFLKEAKNSDNPNVASITDVIFSFVSEDEFTDSGGNGYSIDLEGVDTDNRKSKSLKAKSALPMIAGMAAAVSIMVAAFIYTRRNRRGGSGYKLSEEYDTDLESVPTVPKLMLSDLAAGSVQNSMGYASLITGVWASKKCSMSELAAGATQEDFARHGLQVDVYGKSGGNKKERSKKKLSPNSKVKGTMMVTNLDPIEEVRSATGSESWHEGDEQITNAPPLLPSLSVSNSSGSEADEQDASFRTPRISDMTEYTEMSSIDGSPVFSASSNSTPMRHLNFSSGSYTDDDSVQDAMDPFKCDTSDECPIEKCVAEEKDIEVVPLGFEDSAEKEEGEEEDAKITLPSDRNYAVTSDAKCVSGTSEVDEVTVNATESVFDRELHQTYAYGKEVNHAVFGSEPLELTQSITDQNYDSLIISDDESAESAEEDIINSTLSVDGHLTDISLSGNI
jgi:hypothetical protein